MINSRQTLLIASFSGVLAVSLGAFGAHALKSLLVENDRLDTYELAVRYHFYNTLALLAIGILLDRQNSKYLSWSALFIVMGMLFFSGSLYILALLNTSVALITPLGGVFMIIGWGLLFYSVIKNS